MQLHQADSLLHGEVVYQRMMRTVISLLSMTLVSAPLFAAEAPALGQTLDGQFRNAEHEIVGLVEAMPADKINFSPRSAEFQGSDFQGVRTFGQQAKHLATYIYMES